MKNWTIKNFNELSVYELYEIMRSRFEVFAREQRIIDEDDLDGLDDKCIHIFLKDNGKIATYCRIVPKEIGYDYISIGRVLVLKQYRKKGLAKEMMEECIKYIKENTDEKTIVVSAQKYVENLYKSVGFTSISQIYEEAGIPHIKMRLRL